MPHAAVSPWPFLEPVIIVLIVFAWLAFHSYQQHRLRRSFVERGAFEELAHYEEERAQRRAHHHGQHRGGLLFIFLGIAFATGQWLLPPTHSLMYIWVGLLSIAFGASLLVSRRKRGKD